MFFYIINYISRCKSSATQPAAVAHRAMELAPHVLRCKSSTAKLPIPRTAPLALELGQVTTMAQPRIFWGFKRFFPNILLWGSYFLCLTQPPLLRPPPSLSRTYKKTQRDTHRETRTQRRTQRDARRDTRRETCVLQYLLPILEGPVVGLSAVVASGRRCVVPACFTANLSLMVCVLQHFAGKPPFVIERETHRDTYRERYTERETERDAHKEIHNSLPYPSDI